jgi:hypothetical protein
MQYGVAHSSSSGGYNDDHGFEGVGYAVPFQPAVAAAAVSAAAGVVVGGVGAGLQGQRMKNQQFSIQQQQQQQQQFVEAPPPPLIKFNAPKLSTGQISEFAHLALRHLFLKRDLRCSRQPQSFRQEGAPRAKRAAVVACLTSHATAIV